MHCMQYTRIDGLHMHQLSYNMPRYSLNVLFDMRASILHCSSGVFIGCDCCK